MSGKNSFLDNLPRRINGPLAWVHDSFDHDLDTYTHHFTAEDITHIEKATAHFQGC